MPLVVNGNKNIWFVKFVRGNEEFQAKKYIANGIEVWNRFDMEEKVEISASLSMVKNQQTERIRINNITPYQITITNVTGSMLNNGTKNIIVSPGEDRYISASTRFVLGGGYTIEVTYTCDENIHTKSAYVAFV